MRAGEEEGEVEEEEQTAPNRLGSGLAPLGSVSALKVALGWSTEGDGDDRDDRDDRVGIDFFKNTVATIAVSME